MYWEDVSGHGMPAVEVSNGAHGFKRDWTSTVHHVIASRSGSHLNTAEDLSGYDVNPVCLVLSCLVAESKRAENRGILT